MLGATRTPTCGQPHGGSREAGRAVPPCGFGDFERMLRLVAERGAPRSASGAGGWAGQRAASLARRAGACDHLITAALAHDFAEHFDGRDGGDLPSRSARLLVAVFPEQVLEPLRWLDREPELAPTAPRPARHALTQGRRLRTYVEAARTCGDDSLLSWQALLKIARRASLDG